MSRVVHFEIHADDLARAREFYTSLFGWEFRKWDGGFEYWLIKTGPASDIGIDGGMVKRMGPIDGQAVTAYVCTIGVGSLDQSLETAVRLGGSIAHPKMPIPGMGWLAYAKDSEGNIFGMMQPDESAA